MRAPEDPMRYEMISADCHLDLCWLPTDLFVARAAAGMRDRMPHVIEEPKGKTWVTKKGANLGLVNGMGSAGREYVPGRIHRADRMAETGLYEDGKKGIRRLSDPDLRLRDQDRDGVQAEVLYGILGATGRMNDPEATVEVMRIYNEWLAEFCGSHPERYAGLASIPNQPIEAAIAEVERVAKRGAVRGLDIANSPDLKPLWDPSWNALWEVIDACGLPIHFHTIGTRLPEPLQRLVHMGSDLSRAPADATPEDKRLARMAFATHITGFQINMAGVLTSIIFGGVLERYPRIRVVLGEAGIGWIPYVLWRMDAEWEDQFKDLSLTMPPSEYWRRQCWATDQTDPVGLKLLDELGVDKIMWGSDFPHPDGVWPDSREYIAREMAGVPADVRRKIVCENAARLYGFRLEGSTR
jgi:predicted TIM-barrel fold metal-dependent hydrolase